ncbi:MAG: ATP-binding protein [Clostridia bacterium]|nr:ATP-binding protein [Clostridia bacterium]
MVFEVENYATMKQAIDSFCRFLGEENIPAESVFTSKLAATELIGNVLRHAQGTARLCGEIKDGCIHLTVFSTPQFIPPATTRQADLFAEHGRGLFLVDEVSMERTLTADGGILVKIKIGK